MNVLVVNAGSSSVKIRLVGPDDTLLHRADLPAQRGRFDPAELLAALRGAGEVDSGRIGPGRIDAVGHRIVHGGRFARPVRLDDGVLAELGPLAELAPLHQPPALAAARAVQEALPGVPGVACFDTAFHATMPAAASTYAVPARWRTDLGVRRYGFHGLAHEWAARRASELTGGHPRTVVAHLGSGASLCAVAWDGDRPRSVDTTMGFTPTAGLVMGTRCGDLDPSVPLWLVRRHGTEPGLDADAVAEALDHGSGLAGLAGSADMRVVLDAERAGRPEAVLAVQVWLHRVRAGVAAMAAALGGIDALVFSGGIGENAATLRARTVDGLGFLGLALDEPPADAHAGTDVDIGAASAAARTFVVHAREDLVIAGQVRRLLGSSSRTAPTEAAELPA